MQLILSNIFKYWYLISIVIFDILHFLIIIIFMQVLYNLLHFHLEGKGTSNNIYKIYIYILKYPTDKRCLQSIS